jgi:hypothetical protein
MKNLSLKSDFIIWIVFCLSAAVCALFLSTTAARWNPILSHDTRIYYFPTQEVLNSNYTWQDILIRPFAIDSSVKAPSASEAKPVFVVALRAWGVVYRSFTGDSNPFPNHREYSSFILATCLFYLG